MSQGVVAAGHPLTAEAGAAVLRKGGNAVDAAVCAVLASFAVESPLTGFGAGGFMLVHADGADPVLIDFFVAAPGKTGIEGEAPKEYSEVNWPSIVSLNIVPALLPAIGIKSL